MTSDTRPLRADARRNRDRLLEVALAAFTQPETGEVTLEAIAKEAGVGIGTLYRHFPTREALVEATYRQELDRLGDSAAALAVAEPGDVALRTWFDHFVDYMTTKKGMTDALKAVVASGGNPFSHSRDALVGALQTLLDAGIADGTLRADVAAEDVVVGLSGFTQVAVNPDQRDQAGRLLDLLVDGLRAARPVS